ncbi:carboxymuconolactone decarboxylase family protein [Nocardia jejuensis]|uniref:carboxymuconolactone decarboxylase family protein n=1 Tax=Nocardia jejuensis TaxID=328049 RepID=UPI00082AA492|nr:carboxymuconolactone decarboxylase family protein [Nocardia jejuensis]
MTTSAPATDRYELGLEVLRQVSGPSGPAVLAGLDDIAPDLARMTAEFAYGDIYARPGLTLAQRQIATVAALTALGNAAPQLRFHIDAALTLGLTPAEIVEVIIHTSVYAGFPAALNGLTAARAAFAARPDLDSTPAPGTHHPEETSRQRYERGLTQLARIDGRAGDAVIRSLSDIAPDLGRYIVEFAFADVYSREGLNLRDRELATIAACTALGTAGPQLRVHLHGLLNVGGTRTQAVETIIQMAVYAGFPAALNGIAAAREVFTERDTTGVTDPA